jgi:hypothetical protein
VGEGVLETEYGAMSSCEGNAPWNQVIRLVDMSARQRGGRQGAQLVALRDIDDVADMLDM